MTANEKVAAEIRRMAEQAALIAAELAEYADAVEADVSLGVRLGDRYAGSPAVVQIIDEVEHRTRKPDSDGFRRALTHAFADAQRLAGVRP